MSAATLEISEDYDHDNMPIAPDRDPIPPIEDPLAPLDDELAECESYSQELDRFWQATMAVETFGMTPGTFGIMKAHHLLCGTSIEVLGMESFANQSDEQLESAMAVESLVDTLREKAAAWGAKIISFVKSSVTTILNVLTALKDKIMEKGKQLIEKTWDATKATGRAIKAHPYKTVMIAIGAAIAVMAVVAITAAPGTYASVDSLKAAAYQMRDKIAKIGWPKKMAIEVVDTERYTSLHWVAETSSLEKTHHVIETVNVKELGWTQSAVKTVLGEFGKLWNSTKSVLSNVSTPVINAAKKLNDLGEKIPDVARDKVAAVTGSNFTGWVAKKWVDKIAGGLILGMFGVVVKLMKTVTLKAYHMVLEAFNGLKSEAQPA